MSKKDQHQEEKEKRFLMWSAIIFFMVLIASLWSFNMENFFETAKQKDTGIAQEVKEDTELQALMNDISREFGKLKNVTPSQESASATTTGPQENSNSEQKEFLQKLEKDLEQE